jgi:predicted transcriptional regulator of viral defense system
MKLFELEQKLANYKLFSPVDFKRVTGLSDAAAHKLIARYTHKGIFIKIRNGLYCFKNAPPPSRWLLANALYRPSYISFETALSYYGMIPETTYPVLSATPKITRSAAYGETQFIYRSIKQSAFSGYQPIMINNDTILIAEPEKALVDYLYFLYLKKTPSNDRLNSHKCNKQKIFGYVTTFKNPLFEKWILHALRTLSA